MSDHEMDQPRVFLQELKDRVTTLKEEFNAAQNEKEKNRLLRKISESRQHIREEEAEIAAATREDVNHANQQLSLSDQAAWSTILQGKAKLVGELKVGLTYKLRETPRDQIMQQFQEVEKALRARAYGNMATFHEHWLKIPHNTEAAEKMAVEDWYDVWMLHNDPTDWENLKRAIIKEIGAPSQITQRTARFDRLSAKYRNKVRVSYEAFHLDLQKEVDLLMMKEQVPFNQLPLAMMQWVGSMLHNAFGNDRFREKLERAGYLELYYTDEAEVIQSTTLDQVMEVVRKEWERFMKTTSNSQHPMLSTRKPPVKPTTAKPPALSNTKKYCNMCNSHSHNTIDCRRDRSRQRASNRGANWNGDRQVTLEGSNVTVKRPFAPSTQPSWTAGSQQPFRGKCNECAQVGHKAFDCPQRKRRMLQQPQQQA